MSPSTAARAGATPAAVSTLPAAPRDSRRLRLALAALVLPFGVGVGVGTVGCAGRGTDAPPSTTPAPATTSTTTTSTTETLAIVGRPLRRRNGRPRRARSRRGHSHITDRFALQLDPTTRAVLARHWREQAEMEHTSVAAFHDLAARLAALEAPEHLVHEARRAARHEADHAGRCFDLAARYLGHSLRPGRLRLPHRLPRTREAELCQLAVEALREGVVNEGYAAWLAARQATRASDHLVRATLEVIATDEAEHAAYSAAVLQWCLATGGPAVHRAATAAAAALPSRLLACTTPTIGDRQLLADHGLFDPDPDGAGCRAVVETALALVPAAGTILARRRSQRARIASI